ncbi:hypothetical protein Peur_030339 [Populus x canadensis]
MEASSKQLEMWAQVEGDQECFARALITRASLAQEQCIGLANINRQNRGKKEFVKNSNLVSKIPFHRYRDSREERP